MYDIVINRASQKKLNSLSKSERVRIAEKIYWLGINPDDVILDIKAMEGESDCYRLRIGNWRVIFTRDDIIRLIKIEKIGSRGDVYK